jgi:thioredoxin 2
MSGLSLDDHGVLTPCVACGKTNRQAFAHLGQPARCGHCHADLAAPAEPVDVPDVHVFDHLIATARVPVLLDFWAPWCAPCRVVAPEVEKVARSLRGRLLVAKINTDVFPDLAGRYRIRSIPTFIVFRNGAESVRRSGAFDAADLVRFLGEAVA